jgi:hypothetical protein
LHNKTKTWKESNILIKIFYKQHGLNYFGPSYWKVLLISKIIQCMCNTSLRVYKKKLGSITYLLKPRLHNHAKAYKGKKIMFRVIYEHHGFNYFGLSYWKGIVHAQSYSIHLHYHKFISFMGSFQIRAKFIIS